MSRGGWSHGKAIVDGVVRYFSPSALTLGDPESEGCYRKYYYKYVLGISQPESDANRIGTRVHAEIEEYLTTGRNVLGSLALRGRHMLPAPGDDLLVEADIALPLSAYADRLADLEVARDAELEGRHDVAAALRARAATLPPSTLATAPLRASGVPIVGYIDLIHARGVNQGASDFEDAVDPPKTVEVYDWKTTSRPDYIKSAVEMSRTVQMTTYGMAAIRQLDVDHVRLSHGYFVTKGSAAPRKVTLRVLPDVLIRQWERVDRLAGSLVDVARASDVDLVPANTKACDAFGGCFYRDQCSAGEQSTMASFFGPAGAERMIRRLNTVTTPAPVPAAARAPLLRRAAPPSAAPAPVDHEAALVENKRLAREEVEAKHPGLPAAWEALLALKLGYPQFSGELGVIVRELGGDVKPDPTAGVAGCGDLAEFGPFKAPDEMFGLLEEATAFAASIKAAAANSGTVSPPDAPPSGPPAAAPTGDAPKKRGRPPKAKPAEVTAPAAPAAPTDATVKHLTPDEAKAIDATIVAIDAAAAVDPVGALAFTSAPAVGTPVHVYIDCVPSVLHQDLWPGVHEVVGAMNERAAPAAHYTLVPNTHDFAYGRWRAYLKAGIAHVLEDLPGGHYVLAGARDELGIAAAHALREISATRGWVFVQ